jgi:hypothetical protein
MITENDNSPFEIYIFLKKNLDVHIYTGLRLVRRCVCEQTRTRLSAKMDQALQECRQLVAQWGVAENIKH